MNTGNGESCIGCWKRIGIINSYGLTESRAGIVDYVLKGYSRKEMAEASGLKVNTIGSYMKKLYRKLNIHNRTGVKRNGVYQVTC